MTIKSFVPTVLLALAIGLGPTTTSASPSSCAGLQSTIQKSDAGYKNASTTFYAAGSLVSITNNVYNITTNTLPAFCRAQFVIPTSSRTSAKTEVWLPEASEWSGRYLGLGNAGLAGAVDVTDLGFLGVKQNFAAMSTDMGHTDGVFGNGTWGTFNVDARIDFGYRATHLATVAAKSIITSYYSKSISKSYWIGCSTGGRQGWKEIQEYPDEYDGVIVGAPSNYETHLQPWILHQQSHVLPVGSPQWIPADLWVVIHQEVLSQCDSIDGVKDGIIGDPRRCSFRPETLTCRPGQKSGCLTRTQISALKLLYSPWVDVNQTFVFDGYEPGGEIAYSLPLIGYAGPTIFPISAGYFSWVYNVSPFDRPLGITYQDVIVADREDVGSLNAIEPNITRFVGDRKGKVMAYFGWADSLVPPRDSLRMYASVQESMNRNTRLDIDDYYRAFPVAGMGHCYGGDGANSFGQSGTPLNPPLRSSPEYNIILSMIDWVESSDPPEQLIATKYNGDYAASGVNSTRPVCRFPKDVVYKGTGSIWEAENFDCV